MSSDETSMARVGTSAAAEARAHRDDLTWVADADLRTLEQKDTNAAWALSMFFGGGGQLYTGQYAVGAGLIAADIALLYFFWPLYFALGAVSSVFAFKNARAINRYLAARDAQQGSDGPNPAEYRLLAAMTAADPRARLDAAQMQAHGLMAGAAAPADKGVGKGVGESLIVAGIDVGAIKTRLSQLAALRQNSVVSAEEHRERRIDALDVLKGLSRDEMDEVLFQLIPLINEGYLSQEDITFLKQMGGA